MLLSLQFVKVAASDDSLSASSSSSTATSTTPTSTSTSSSSTSDEGEYYDERTLLDNFGEAAKIYLTQKVIPPTDPPLWP